MSDKPMTIKVGRIRATVWTNQSEARQWHTVTFSRLYKDKEGKWQDGVSFSRDDLPLLMKAADQAHTFLYQHEAESTPGDERDPGIPPAPYDTTPPQRSR